MQHFVLMIYNSCGIDIYRLRRSFPRRRIVQDDSGAYCRLYHRPCDGCRGLFCPKMDDLLFHGFCWRKGNSSGVGKLHLESFQGKSVCALYSGQPPRNEGHRHSCTNRMLYNCCFYGSRICRSAEIFQKEIKIIDTKII